MDLDHYELDFVIWIFCPPLINIDLCFAESIFQIGWFNLQLL